MAAKTRKRIRGVVLIDAVARSRSEQQEATPLGSREDLTQERRTAMKGMRHSEEQIIAILKPGEAGLTTAEKRTTRNTTAAHERRLTVRLFCLRESCYR